MVYKYRTYTYTCEIEKVEIEHENKNSIWINGRACRKRTHNSIYCDSWDEARNFLLDYGKAKVNEASNILKDATVWLTNVELLKSEE
jgi:hypothetical protein